MRGIKLGIWICIIFIVPILLMKWWWNSQIAPVSSAKEEKVIIVSKGDSFSQISDKLRENNLIRSTWAFKLEAKQQGVESRLKVGSFKISPALSTDEILKILTSNPQGIKVTLIEGWRVEEMADQLSLKFNLPAGRQEVQSSKFLVLAKEGYMFPDTYLFPEDVNIEQVVKTLRDNFDKKYTNDLKEKITKQGLTENQGVILASIVEREARSAEARRMVASILLKRFKISMGLNADATIQYALGYQPSEKSWWKKDLSPDDLKIDSPFNTYLHVGLPPAPICNPSLSSLEAVANADSSTPYLYYYHDSKGNSYYAETLDEHNMNVVNHP